MPFAINSDGTFTLTGVDPTGQTDCSSEINSVVNSIWNNYGGGKLWLPRPGSYLASQIIMRGEVTLLGHGERCTSIGAKTRNENTFTFDTSVRYGGLRDLFVESYMGANPQGNAVNVAANVPVVIENCHIWGGSSAIYTQGIDGRIDGCFLCGWSFAAVVSNGANWYRRCKMDTADSSVHVQHAFYQGTPVIAGVMENHFDQCDFSGNYGASVTIDDNNTHTAISAFTSSVFSSPVVMWRHGGALFGQCEFGSDVFVTPPDLTAVTGSMKLGGLLTLPAGVAHEANINIV